MLTIQPNFTNYRASRPYFGISADRIEDEKNFYQEKVAQLDEFLDNDIVPEKIKKPFKFFRVIGNAAFTGLAVFGSFLGIASAAKEGKARVIEYNFVKKSASKIKDLNLGNKLSNLFDAIKANKYVKKVTTPINEFVEKNPIAQKVTAWAKKSKEFVANIFTPLKDKVNGEKMTKGTATVLGTGSGAAAGYEEYIKENPVIVDAGELEDEVDE